MTIKSQRFVQYFTAWLLATLVALVLVDALELELFFVVSLIGLLIITELTMPVNIRPQWQRRLRWLIVGGVAVFGYIILRRVLEILQNS